MSGTQGATAQTGQSAGAGQTSAGTMRGQAGAATSGSGMFVLRATDSGSGNSRTGMPSATSGQTDERSAAGQQSGKVYHLMADGSTNLAAHVGHQIEVTGTLSSMAGAASSHSGAHRSGGTATSSAGAAGAGSGSSGYTGQATSGSGSTGSGAAGGTGTSSTGTTAGSSQPGSSTSTMGAMDSTAAGGTHAGMIRVTNVKMIAATCR
jgi:hypothetical protein